MKKQKHKCVICKNEIVIPGERYCIIKEYDREDNEVSEGYYHIVCYREKFLLKTQEANEVLGMSKYALNNVLGQFK